MAFGAFVAIHAATKVKISKLSLRNRKKNNSRKTADIDLPKKNIIKKDVLDFSSEANEFLKNKFVEQCLFELEKDEDVKNIIQKYIEKTKELKIQDEKKIQDKFLELCTQIEEVQNNTNISVKEVENLGFHLGFTSSIFCDKLIVKKAENEAGFAFSTTFIRYVFNGLNLKKDHVLRDINIYKSQLDNFVKNNPNLKEQLDTLKKEYSSLAKKKLLLKISKKAREKLDVLKNKISKLENLYQLEIQYRKLSDFYESLTNDQKQILVKYFDNVEALEKLSNSVKDIKKFSQLLCGKFENETDNTNYKNLMVKRLEDAKESLTEEERLKLEQFCLNASKNILQKTNEEIEEAINFENSVIDSDKDSIMVYKYICLNIKENTNSVKREQFVEKCV